MTEEQLTAQLQQLADRIEVPPSVVADDVARARARRRRTTAGGLGVAGVVAATALLTTVAGGGPGGSVTPVAKDPSVAASSASAPSPKAPPSRCLEDAATPGYGGDPMPRQIIGYRKILAERLDPAGTHLQRRPDNLQGGSSLDGSPQCPAGMSWAVSLGTKLAWRVPGESGMGMLQVEVAEEPWADLQVAMGYDSWKAQTVTLPGVRAARVARYDGGTAVIVTRTDGLSVAIDANTLFGNNSLTPVKGVDLTTDQLLATAADPRFTLD